MSARNGCNTCGPRHRSYRQLVVVQGGSPCGPMDPNPFTPWNPFIQINQSIRSFVRAFIHSFIHSFIQSISLNLIHSISNTFLRIVFGNMDWIVWICVHRVGVTWDMGWFVNIYVYRCANRWKGVGACWSSDECALAIWIGLGFYFGPTFPLY